MKKYKKYILIFLAVLVIYYLVLTRGSMNKVSVKRNVSKDEIKQTLASVAAAYGVDIARNVERIFAWETAHFASNAFLITMSPGMNATKSVFPYGWGTLSLLWANPLMSPNGIYEHFDGVSVVKQLSFSSLKAGMFALAEILKQRKNNAGSWYSTKKDKQDFYVAKIGTIKLRYV